MTSLLLTFALMAAALAAGLALFRTGIRRGDRLGETLVSNIELDLSAEAVRFTVQNPGEQTVVLGASVRPASVRSLVEGGRFVQIPRRTSQASFSAGRYDVLGTVQAGGEATPAVPVPANVRRRGELFLAIGERERLRVIRHRLDVPSLRRSRTTGLKGGTR